MAADSPRGRCARAQRKRCPGGRRTWSGHGQDRGRSAVRQEHPSPHRVAGRAATLFWHTCPGEERRVFDSPWLDIAIGVVFVWFFCSLAVSALNEMVVRLLAVRSKQLWLALNQMLDGNYTMQPVWRQLFRTVFHSGRPE